MKKAVTLAGVHTHTHTDSSSKIKNIEEKGITLIALIITIVVLLILASISIVAITGNESTPQKASQARDKHERATELNDIQTAVTASIKETGYNVEVDRNKMIEKISNLVTENNLNTIITGEGPWTVTGKTGSKYQITNDGEAVFVTQLQIGDSVNYSTVRNGITLDNWKVFYKEIKDGQEYSYLIYGDYLPNNAIDISCFTGISKSNTYAVYSSSCREDLIDGMNSSYWDELKRGTINGKSIDYSNSADENVIAIGSPTLELWQASWNTRYPNTTTYTSNQIYISFYTNGYKVSNNNTSFANAVNINNTEGYNNLYYNALYFPYKNVIDNECHGYWLDSPSENSKSSMICVTCGGVVGNNLYYRTYYAFRPVICFPSSELE